jgi:hypothetical protein
MIAVTDFDKSGPLTTGAPTYAKRLLGGVGSGELHG